MQAYQRTATACAIASILAIGGLGVSGQAMAEVSANIGITSNYVFRGLTESDDDAAVQGGVDYNHASGLYLGTWVSSLGGGGDYEIDGYFGFANELSSGFGYDLGYVYYAYPRADDSDAGEIYLNLSFSQFSAGVAYVINADDSDWEKTLSYELGAEFPVAADMSLGAQIGYVDPNPSDDTNYTWWSLSLNKATSMGDFSFAYVQNDLDDDDDPRFLVSYTMNF